MQAITTKYIGPRAKRGSRIKATSASGQSVTLTYEPALRSEENHRRVAQALATKLGWHGVWVEGGLNNDGNVYVCLRLADGFTVDAPK